MLETDIRLVVRQKDVSITEGLLAEIKRKFKNITRISVNLRVDKSHFLKQERHFGGVILCNNKNNIYVDNTFATRFRVISSFIIPFIRKPLFGENVKGFY